MWSGNEGHSLADYNIKYNLLMLSVYLCPKAITLSNFYCIKISCNGPTNFKITSRMRKMLYETKGSNLLKKPVELRKLSCFVLKQQNIWFNKRLQTYWNLTWSVTRLTRSLTWSLCREKGSDLLKFWKYEKEKINNETLFST